MPKFKEEPEPEPEDYGPPLSAFPSSPNNYIVLVGSNLVTRVDDNTEIPFGYIDVIHPGTGQIFAYNYNPKTMVINEDGFYN